MSRRKESGSAHSLYAPVRRGFPTRCLHPLHAEIAIVVRDLIALDPQGVLAIQHAAGGGFRGPGQSAQVCPERAALRRRGIF